MVIGAISFVRRHAVGQNVVGRPAVGDVPEPWVHIIAASNKLASCFRSDLSKRFFLRVPVHFLRDTHSEKIGCGCVRIDCGWSLFRGETASGHAVYDNPGSQGEADEFLELVCFRSPGFGKEAIGENYHHSGIFKMSQGQKMLPDCVQQTARPIFNVRILLSGFHFSNFIYCFFPCCIYTAAHPGKIHNLIIGNQPGFKIRHLRNIHHSIRIIRSILSKGRDAIQLCRNCVKFFKKPLFVIGKWKLNLAGA